MISIFLSITVAIVDRFFFWAASALTCDTSTDVNDATNDVIDGVTNESGESHGGRFKRSFMPFRSEKFMSKQVTKPNLIKPIPISNLI